jgi:hypothetical protein
VEGWPDILKKKMEADNFFTRAESLLNVKNANAIPNFVEAKLGPEIFEKMTAIVSGLKWETVSEEPKLLA